MTGFFAMNTILRTFAAPEPTPIPYIRSGARRSRARCRMRSRSYLHYVRRR